MLDLIDVNILAETEIKRSSDDSPPAIAKHGLRAEISKQVVRKKLAKQRHLVIEKGINPDYLDSLFPTLLELFEPQVVKVSSLHSFPL